MKIGPNWPRSAIRSASSRSSGVKSMRVVDGDALEIERRRLRRKRLRRGVPLSGHVARRHRPLFYGPDRLAGHPVEHIGERLLARLGDRLDLASVDGDVDQIACRRKVVVPEPVMDRLEMPDALAGLGVDADDALGEQVVPMPHPAVPVVGRRAGREIDVAELLVDGHRSPDVRVSAVAPRLVLPGIRPELVALRNGVEDPLHLAGARVEAAHVPGRGLTRLGAVPHHAADDHGVACDGDR